MIISGIDFNAFITRIVELRHCTGDMRGVAHNLNGHHSLPLQLPPRSEQTLEFLPQD